MFQRKQRGFRRRPNGRNRSSHQENGYLQTRPRPNSFTNSHQPRNNFRNTQSAERLFEKYSALAKEAISSGDKTLGENYLQHADHFMRIVEDKNKNREQNKTEAINKTTTESKPSLEDNNNKQEEVTKNKE